MRTPIMMNLINKIKMINFNKPPINQKIVESKFRAIFKNYMIMIKISIKYKIKANRFSTKPKNSDKKLPSILHNNKDNK